MSLCLAVMAVSCGGDGLTEADYAAQVESLVAEMEADFDAADSEWEAQTPGIEGARRYWDRRLEIRAEFLEGVRDLAPPDQIESMHEQALDVFERITAADEALAAKVATLTTITDHRQWLDTPEGEASLAVLQEVYEFCRASQEDFDATEERAALQDDSWIPPDMKQVIKVAFGCPADP